MGGLHDDGHAQSALAHLRQHAEAVEVGHDQVEDNAIDARFLRVVQQGQRRVAAVGGQRPIAETRDHRLQQPALHRIVVDDENRFCHVGSNATQPQVAKENVPNWRMSSTLR